MKKIFIYLIVITLFSFVILQLFFKEKIVTISAGTLDYRNITFLQETKDWKNSKIQFSYAVINTALSPVGIIAPKALEQKINKNNFSGYSLEEYSELGDYKVALSGGFMSSFSPPAPLGYVKIKGIEYNKTHNSWLTTGLFCTNGNFLSVGRYISEKQYKNWISCMQAGPLMIENRKNVLLTERNTGYITKPIHRQSFLCEVTDQKLIMGIAEGTSLIGLTDYLEKNLIAGYACNNAVALNPKGFSGLFLNYTENKKSIGVTNAPIATAIVVK